MVDAGISLSIRLWAGLPFPNGSIDRSFLYKCFGFVPRVNVCSWEILREIVKMANQFVETHDFVLREPISL